MRKTLVKRNIPTNNHQEEEIKNQENTETKKDDSKDEPVEINDADGKSEEDEARDAADEETQSKEDEVRSDLKSNSQSVRRSERKHTQRFEIRPDEIGECDDENDQDYR